MATVNWVGGNGNWSVSGRDGATATMTEAPGVVPRGDTAAGSLRVSYDFPAGAGVKQVVLWPKRGDEVTADSAGLDPGRVVLCLVPTPDVSGSGLRRAIAAGEAVGGKLPPAVERYIADHHLYGDNR